MPLPPAETLHGIVTSLCLRLDDSPHWLYCVPGAAIQLEIDLVLPPNLFTRKLVYHLWKEVPVVDVYNAHIIQAYETNNAILPFMTVPFLKSSKPVREILHGKSLALDL